ncbi:MAG: single-strand DNA-binding protein [Candidatus Berkelbacteria bacterium Athens1014_28]|uniref:Single-stranded DNA-binding protein n=1 Tax=Candidatus Berkelbacteria bacterium Athens1014_28 TaxID=2017145 RepID=A0A554LJ12_9BACT|nr:MAG: single-strand DNA-binding protein [Candidatus Berkelbacteria bacterium Athens1014_28]
MFSLNRATILGNTTRDPEMRYTPNGHAVASFSVATNRRWTNRETGEMQEQVEFHDIVLWGKMAENASQYLKKGQPVYVEGRLQTRNWEGQDGVKRYRTEIVADNFILLGRKSDSGGYEAPRAEKSTNTEEKPADAVEKPAEKPAADSEEIDINDIPF